MMVVVWCSNGTRWEMMESVERTGASLIKTHSNMSTNEHSLTFGTLGTFGLIYDL